MTDLAEQLRSYIDVVAEPVGLDELTRHRKLVGHRRSRIGIAVVAALLVLAVVAAIALLAHSDGSPATAPVKPASSHGRGLDVATSEPCAADVVAGTTVALSGRLTNGVHVCITELDGVMHTFLDGSEPYRSPGYQIPPADIEGLVDGATPTGHVLSIATVSDHVALVRFTYCDGTTVDVPTFAGADPAFRFVVLETTDTSQGLPGYQALDPNGTVLLESAEPRQLPKSSGGLSAGCRHLVPPPPLDKWALHCATLEGIRLLSEAPSAPTGQEGLDELDRMYSLLVDQAPSRNVAQLWRMVRPVLGHGVMVGRPTSAQRVAVRDLNALLARHCSESTGNIFKISIS